MSKVLVTGASGKAGNYVVSDLYEAGHEIVGCDNRDYDGPHQSAAKFKFHQLDTTQLEPVGEAMTGCAAVIHLAAIPSPMTFPEQETFRVNMLSNWAVLEAAENLNVAKVVMASSVNAVGAVFSKAITPRPYFPIDEEQPTFCEDAYSQSKWLGEEMASAFCRRRSMQIASMRFHWLATHQEQIAHRRKVEKEGYPEFHFHAKHFWGWTDIAEAARACTLAIEKSWEGHQVFFINGDDTMANLPTMECIERVYPETTIKSPLPGFTTAISNEKAKQWLGWEPRVSWRTRT